MRLPGWQPNQREHLLRRVLLALAILGLRALVGAPLAGQCPGHAPEQRGADGAAGPAPSASDFHRVLGPDAVLIGVLALALPGLPPAAAYVPVVGGKHSMTPDGLRTIVPAPALPGAMVTATEARVRVRNGRPDVTFFLGTPASGRH